MMTTEQNRALQLSVEAGHILLENGAEISRVEETMERISSHYGVEEQSFFVLSNGIIATGEQYASAKFIPIKGMQLSRVAAVNQVSRDIADVRHKVTLDELSARLKAIRASKGKPWWELTLGVALGVSTFCILFGGSLADAVATFACGLLLGLFMAFVSPHMSRLLGNVAGGLIGGLLCIATFSFFNSHSLISLHLPNMIIGTIIALVPGGGIFWTAYHLEANHLQLAATTGFVALKVTIAIAGGIILATAIGTRIYRRLKL